MNTALIIICIVFCVGVVLWALSHFGTAITLDKRARDRGVRKHRDQGVPAGQTRDLSGGPTA
jgi:hypothetical protein